MIMTTSDDRRATAFRMRSNRKTMAEIAEALDLATIDEVAELIERHTDTFAPDTKLTRWEAAAILDISLPRLAQLRRAGAIHHHKNRVTRAVHYEYRDVAALKARRAAAMVQFPTAEQRGWS